MAMAHHRACRYVVVILLKYSIWNQIMPKIMRQTKVWRSKWSSLFYMWWVAQILAAHVNRWTTKYVCYWEFWIGCQSGNPCFFSGKDAWNAKLTNKQTYKWMNRLTKYIVFRLCKRESTSSKLERLDWAVEAGEIARRWIMNIASKFSLLSKQEIEFGEQATKYKMHNTKRREKETS